jgi:hypothetical protein
MKNLSNQVLSSLAVLALATACGKSDGGKSSSDGGRQQQEEAASIDGSHIQGLYNAKFITLNPHVNGTIPGSATFFRKEEKFYAYLRLFAGGPRAWHQQFVYEGNRCPNLNDDINLDGFIDIQEAEAVLGKILIPLDSDIGTQSSGRRFFPLGDLSGYYHYERITNFRRFLSDLQEEDSTPEDDTRKLAADEPLRIIGKPVMVMGVVETVQLPETVATKGRHRAFQTLPIACGVFSKVEGLPGEPWSDQIPGPVGEVQEGQDRPAEDLPGETTGGGTGSTTGTNDSDDGDGPVSDGEGGTAGRSTSGSTGGSTTGGSTTGSTTGGSGTTSGSSTSGGTSGSTTGGTTGGASTSDTTTGSSTTTSTTTSSTSSSSSTTGTSAGGSLDSSSGI